MTQDFLNRTLYTNSPSETQALGQQIGAAIYTFLCAHPIVDDATETIALSGELGAGKTTFTQGVAAGLGVNEPVTSPTFTLVNEYTVPVRVVDEDEAGKDSAGVEYVATTPFDSTPITLIHMDSYRLAGNDAQNGELTETAALDAATFGIDEFFEIPRSLVIIEWAERIKTILPADHLALQLAYGDEGGDDGVEVSESIEPTSKRVIHIEARGPNSAKILNALSDEADDNG